MTEWIIAAWVLLGIVIGLAIAIGWFIWTTWSWYAKR